MFNLKKIALFILFSLLPISGFSAVKTIQWNVPASDTSLLTPPFCQNNMMFVNGKAYDLDSGKVLWEAPAVIKNQRVYYFDAIFHEGNLYFSVPNVGIVKFNVQTRKIEYLNIPGAEKPRLAFVLLGVGDNLYVSFATNLLCYSLKENKILWKLKIYLNTASSLVTDGNNLFFYNYPNPTAVSLKSGKVKWASKAMGGDGLIYKAGLIYLAAGTRVSAINAEDGKSVWRFSTQIDYDQNQFDPIGIQANSYGLYFRDDNNKDKNVYALNRLTGKLMWKIKKYDATYISVTENKLYISDRNHYIYVLNPTTGKQESVIPLDFLPAISRECNGKMAFLGLGKTEKGNRVFVLNTQK